jgi:Family of unknown function (DUF5675)
MNFGALITLILSFFSAAPSQSAVKMVTVTRTETSDEGTFGTLVTDTGFQCFTIELPWRNDMANISCIPPGTYVCNWRFSQKHGMCYHVDGVPDGRTQVEIHAANFAGDVSKGYKCQLEGCLALGESIGLLNGQKAVLESKIAVAQFNTERAMQPFTLVIK